MTTERLSHALQWRIEEIPGDEGWWDEGGLEQFRQVALALVKAGIKESDVATLLRKAYWAVANCYGG